MAALVYDKFRQLSFLLFIQCNLPVCRNPLCSHRNIAEVRRSTFVNRCTFWKLAVKARGSQSRVSNIQNYWKKAFHRYFVDGIDDAE